MKKFNEFIVENTSFKFDPVVLRSKIAPLQNWLVRGVGLGMMYVIDDIFDEYGYATKLTSEEVSKFKNALSLLKKTNIPESYIAAKLVNFEDQTLVRNEMGEWDYLSKLNTNYDDLSDLLVYLIQKGVESENNQGAIRVYNQILEDPVKGLLSIKPYLKDLIVKYLIVQGKGLEDFRKFTTYSQRFTKSGEIGEEKVKDYLKSKGFEIIYSGGNGDFIDMLYGVDAIIYHPDYQISEEKPYLTLQVKTSLKSLDKYKYYKVDWIASAYPIRFFVLKTEEPINI